MTTQPKYEAPANWVGSLPEYVAYKTFVDLGLEPGLDFSYQSPLLGGRMEKGGFVLDFLFTNPPNLAGNVQRVYYHYEFGVEAQARDVIARTALAGDNITLVFIDDDDLYRDPTYYCREALNYKDHSRLGGG